MMVAFSVPALALAALAFWGIGFELLCALEPQVQWNYERSGVRWRDGVVTIRFSYWRRPSP